MKNFKRVGALIVVFLLVSLYITTLVLAFVDTEQAKMMFRGCLIATVGLPLLLYAYMLMFRILKGRGVDEDVKEEAPDTANIKDKANINTKNIDSSENK